MTKVEIERQIKTQIRLVPAEAIRLRMMLQAYCFNRTEVIKDENMERFIFEYVYPSQRNHLQGVLDYLTRIQFNQSTGSLDQLVNTIIGTDERLGFASPNHPNHLWMKRVKKASKILRAEFRRHQVTIRYPETEQELHDMFTRMKTSAGWEFVRCGKRKKNDYTGELLLKLNEVVGEIIAGTYKPDDIVIADRTQNHSELDSDKTRWPEDYVVSSKRRVVLIVSLRQILLEIIFASPLQHKVFHVLPWYAGSFNEFRRAKMLLKWSSNFSNANSADYSNYDVSMSGWLLTEGMDIMKEAIVFEGNVEMLNTLWNQVVHDIIVKNIWTPTGLRIHAIRGNPSGSMFTSMLGSVCNMLIQLSYMIKKGFEWHRDYEIMVMGDDSIIFSVEPIDNQDRSQDIKEVYGITIHPDKCNDDNNTENPMTWFLCRMYTSDGTVRPLEEIVGNFVYPERWRWYYTAHPEKLPKRRRHQYAKAVSEHRLTTVDEIFWAACLMYPATMHTFFNVRKFQDDYPQWRKYSSRKPNAGISGWMEFLVNYGNGEITTWDPSDYLS